MNNKTVLKKGLGAVVFSLFAFLLLLSGCAKTEHTIKFVAPDSTLSFEEVKVTDGETLKELPTVTRANYHLEDWYFEDTYEHKYTADHMFTSSVSLYAKMIPDTFTITYHLTAGAVNPNPTEYSVEQVVTFVPATKDNYLFDGWYLEDTYATAITSTAGKSGNLEIHGKMHSTKTAVTLDKDGGNNTPYSDYFEINQGESLPTNLLPPTKTGYEFDGYYTEKNGLGDQYFESDMTPSISTWSYPEDTLTLYASYTALPATLEVINHNGNVNTVVHSFDYETVVVNDDSCLSGDNCISIETPTYHGYNFDGWYKDSGYATPFTFPATNLLGDNEIHAKWAASTSTITFNHNGGTSSLISAVGTFNELLPTGLEIPSKVGYTFTGYYLNDVMYYDSYVEPTHIWDQVGAQTLTARYVANITTLTIDYQGDPTDNETLTVEYDASIDASSLTVPNVVGHTFLGLFDASNNFNGKKYVNADLSSASIWDKDVATATLYAHYSANTFSVIFDSNFPSNAVNTSGTMLDQYFTYGSEQNLNKNQFYSDNYLFSHWTRDEDGTTAQILDESRGDTLSTIDYDEITLYAQYDVIIPTDNVYLDANGGLGNKITYKADGSFSFPMPLDMKHFTKEDYLHVGYALSPTETDYSNLFTTIDQATYNTNKDTDNNLTLYAIYFAESSLPYEMEYVVQGESQTLDGELPYAIGAPYSLFIKPTDLPQTPNGFENLEWLDLLSESPFDFNAVATSDAAIYAELDAIEYDISYNLNGGSGVDTSKTTYTIEDSDITLASLGTPTLMGYDFGGYFEDAVFTKPISVIDTALCKDVEIHAKWTPVVVSITIKNNDGPGTADKVISATYNEPLSELTTPDPITGYTFGGFYLEATFENELFSTTNCNLVDNTTILHAKWTANTYTITLTDGINPDQTISIKYNDPITLPTLEIQGYTFSGWFIGTDEYKTGDIYIDTSDITLNAGLIPIEYTLTFIDGETTSTYQVFYDTNLPHDLTAPSKTGFTFLGYFDAQTGGKKYYEANMSYAGVTHYDVASNLTLYSQYIENTYTIIFDDNYPGDVIGSSGTMNNQVLNYTDSTALSNNAYTSTNYVFKEWNTESDGSGDVYQDMDEVTKLSAVDGATITLYAIWDVRGVTISYNENYGVTPNVDVDNHTAGDIITTEKPVVRTGYDFIGWFTDPTAGTKITFPYTVGSTDTTFYAHYDAKEYTLTLVDGKGTLSGTSPIDYDSTITLSSPTVPGYTFDGWFDSENNEVEDGDIYSYDENITLTARYTANTYTVTLDNDEVSANITVTYDEDLPAQTTIPSKTGFTFLGYFDANTDGIKYYNADMTSAKAYDVVGATTLYAQYREHEYTINFNANFPGDEIDPVGTMAPQTLKYTDNIQLTENTFGADNYAFIDWNTKSDGTGDSYNDKEHVTKLTAEDNGVITLYATYVLVEQQVTFNYDNGTTPNDVDNYPVGYIFADAPTASKVGYTFIGWFDEFDTIIEFPYEVLTEITLTAHYQAVEVTLNLVDAENSNTTHEVTYDSAYTLPTPVSPDYVFAGWYLEDTYDTLVVSSGTSTFTSSISLYAKYTFTVIFDGNGGNIANYINGDEATSSELVLTKEEYEADGLDLGYIEAAHPFEYDFLGFYEAAHTDSTKVITITPSNTILTVYAHYSVSVFSMNLQENGFESGSPYVIKTGSKVIDYENDEEIDISVYGSSASDYLTLPLTLELATNDILVGYDINTITTGIITHNVTDLYTFAYSTGAINFEVEADTDAIDISLYVEETIELTFSDGLTSFGSIFVPQNNATENRLIKLGSIANHLEDTLPTYYRIVNGVGNTQWSDQAANASVGAPWADDTYYLLSQANIYVVAWEESVGCDFYLTGSAIGAGEGWVAPGAGALKFTKVSDHLYVILRSSAGANNDSFKTLRTNAGATTGLVWQGGGNIGVSSDAGAGLATLASGNVFLWRTGDGVQQGYSAD